MLSNIDKDNVNKIMRYELTAGNILDSMSLKELHGLANRVHQDSKESCLAIYRKWEARGDVSGLEWIPQVYKN